MRSRATMAAAVRGRFFYGWLIVGVTFLTMLAASRVRAVPTVLILPPGHDFGWAGAAGACGWFVPGRGLFGGLLTAAGATGQRVFLPILASAIEAVGWRMAVLLVAAVALPLVPLVAFVMRDSPQQLGLQPYGA